MNSKEYAPDPAPILSKEDISLLLADRSTRAQLDVAEKLAHQYAAEGSQALNSQQIQIANDIFRLLLNRGEVIVRAMLAMNLSQTDKLPAELARQMAMDPYNEVSAPVLQYSESLSDDDLAGIIGSMVDTSKLVAIARREQVSETVSDMLVSTNLEQVVSTLVQNEGAKIAEETFTEIILHHKDNPEVMGAIFQRSTVPVEIIEKVIVSLSASMKRELEHKFGDLVEMKTLKKALDQSLELTSLKLMGFSSTDAELTRLIEHLNKTQKLSPFSALSMCNLQLFEVSLSRILRIPLKNVHILLQHDTGFQVAYERAQLPPQLFRATHLAVKALRIAEQTPGGAQGVVTVQSMIAQMRVLAGAKGMDGLEQLIAMLQHDLRAQ